jgi:hypothetical protein
MDGADCISVISLKDRRKIFEYFQFDGSPDFDNDSIGKKIVASNAGIIGGFNNAEINHSARTLSVFCILWSFLLDLFSSVAIDH